MNLLACVVVMAMADIQMYPAPPLAEPSDRFEASAGASRELRRAPLDLRLDGVDMRLYRWFGSVSPD